MDVPQINLGVGHPSPAHKTVASVQPMHGHLVRLVALAGLLLTAPVLMADWHGKINVLSDYVQRGYSKSRGDPVVQGQFSYQQAQWQAGLGWSQVRFDDRDYPDHADWEIRPSLGGQWLVSTDWQAGLAVTGYVYNGQVFWQAGDYAEVAATLHYQEWFSAKIAVAPEAYQRQATVAYELVFRHDLTNRVQASGGVGYSQSQPLLGRDYAYWNLGVSWYLTPHWILDARYIDADFDGAYVGGASYKGFHPQAQANRYLLSLSFGF